SSIRRNLQRFYLEELTNIALDPNSAWLPGPVRTLARHHVGRLHDRLKAFLGDHAASLDAYTRSHLEECRTLLAKTLEATFQLGGQSGGTFLFF
ncbi:MAG: hypothetical protein JXQ29_14350, partial [Planctomycetes bacterium]|nr:hypothetical protein [Planctomycetota bacterium]